MLRNTRRFAYLCLCLALGFTVQTLAVLGYVQHVNAERDRAAAAAAHDRAVQSEQTRAILCRVIARQAEAFGDATSPTGQEVRKAWLELGTQFGCPPA
jgi:hypothetical protein